MSYRITLCQEVKDNVSGFQGIAICRCIWLHGCERITVQPPMPKKGEQKLPDTHTFDEPQLIIIGDGVKVEEKKERTFGDPSYVPEQH